MDALSVCIEHLLIRVSPLLHSLYNISGFFLEAQSSSSRKKTLREELCAIFKIARSYKSRVDPATQTRKSGSFRNHPQLPIASGELIMKFRVNPSFSGFMT